MRQLTAHVDLYGKSFVDLCKQLISLLEFFYFAIRSIITERGVSFKAVISVVMSQIYFTGVQALPLISVLSFATGAVFVFQGLSHLMLIGNSNVLGGFLVASIFREAAPLLVALVVVARSGTAVASELGNMRANREIDSLITMGINPYSYVVMPRLVGGIISVVALAVYFNFVAFLGGFILVKIIKNISFFYLIESLIYSINIADIYVFLAKNILSGVIIFVICSYQGLQVQKSSHEVPQKTTLAVVQSILYVSVVNFTISILYYLWKLNFFNAKELL